MEKTCMTGMEFSDDFPDEKAAPGKNEKYLIEISHWQTSLES